MSRVIYTLALIFFINAVANAQSTVLTGGNNFSVGLCGTSGKVYAWGNNSNGQIGQGATNATIYNSPTAVVFTGAASALKFTQVNAGSGAHALALDCNGNVWSWGNNNFGQSGNGVAVTCGSTGAGSSTPTPVEVVGGAQGGSYLSNIVLIGAGNNFSFAVDNTGTIYDWGENTNGQLGNNSTTCSSSPVKVTKCSGGTLTGIIQAQGGDGTMYALDNTGHVWTWGENNNAQLGNGNSTDVHCAAEVLKSAGTPLSGIKMVAGGDTHGLALDSSGYVWSWGGNWGDGQIGQGSVGGNAVYAAKVVAPNNFTATSTSGPWLQGVYIAAGQASSVVVQSDGRVVSFGALGLYNGGEGNNGTLGNGIAPGGTASGNFCTSYTAPYTYSGSGCSGYGVPTYVQTSAGVPLTGIASVARGDAWYYAIDSSGTIYAWGANANGELGIGNTTDQGYADHVLTWPCPIATPCPTKPGLGPDLQLCPNTSYTLNANESYSGYTYQWYSSTNGTTFTSVQGPGNTTADTKYTFTSSSSTMYYMVKVTYTGVCGAACTTEYDTIKVTPILPPWSGTGNYCATDPTHVEFKITNPGTGKFKWFYAPTGNTVVGAPGGSDITVLRSATNTGYNSGGTCPYALFAEDTSSYNAALLPGGPAGGCASSSTGNGVGTNGTYMLINVTNSITLNSVQFVQSAGYGAGTGSFAFVIYSNKPGGGPWCGSCSPAGNYDGLGTLQHTSSSTSLSVGSSNITQTIIDNSPYTLTPGKYWIGLTMTGSTGWLEYTCNPAMAAGTDYWSTTYSDNSGYNNVQAMGGMRQGQIQSVGSVFNLSYSEGSPYNCSRLMVCATSGSCPAPVKFMAFTAQQQNSAVLLNWSTTSEQNSSYFSIERSVDGITFKSLGEVAAVGNSNVIHHYSYTDNSAAELNGTLYYRIVEYDINGETTVSTIESVNTGKGSSVKVIPNPNNGSFTVLVEGEQEELELTLFNTIGKVVYAGSGKAEGLVFEQNINIQNMPAGVYFLNVHSPSNTWVKKIVKE